MILDDLHFKIKVIKSSFKGKPCHMTSALWRVIVFHAHILRCPEQMENR